MRTLRIVSIFALFAAAWVSTPAADLPPHRPLRILIVSDEVDPHMLPPAVRTQPGEIAAALTMAGSGLHLDAAPDAVVELPTNSIEQATTLLSAPIDSPAAYDVLIYFAHREPNDGIDEAARQQAFTDAVESFLMQGGGVISFHHGAYTSPQKGAILDLIGATATGNVPWNTIDGQNVINTAPGHFVPCSRVGYGGTILYEDLPRGVPSAMYPFFNNTPDERYINFDYNPSAAGNVQTIFGSDYNENGVSHLLGFVHQRPGWQGRVVTYQPGEYEPNAVGDLNGANFQILANAILYASRALPADDLALAMERGPGAGAVTLNWWGCDADFELFRSSDPTTLTDAGNLLGQTTARSWQDTPPPGALFYYAVLAP